MKTCSDRAGKGSKTRRYTVMKI